MRTGTNHGHRGVWLDRLSQRLIIRHFDGVPREFRINGEIIVKPETVYFTGSRAKKGETCLTLVMIDIDAHKVGDLKNAMRVRRPPAGQLPPGLLHRGQHQRQRRPHLPHHRQDRLGGLPSTTPSSRSWTHWLKGVLAETGIELDDVEIKGTCALVSWKDGVPSTRRACSPSCRGSGNGSTSCGQAPTYTAHQLLAMAKATSGQGEGSCAEGPEDAAGGQHPRPPASIPSGSNAGWKSASGCCLSPVHVGKSANNRLVVTGEDVGIFCALLEFVGKHMNEDGTLPWARTKGLWDCLYERGVVSRSFNAKRFAWIRRFLSGAGLVDVQDPTYVIGERAAKWSPSEKFWVGFFS